MTSGKQVSAFIWMGVSFTHKTHPMDQAHAPKKKLWRKKKERLTEGMTAKSNNERGWG